MKQQMNDVVTTANAEETLLNWGLKKEEISNIMETATILGESLSDHILWKIRDNQQGILRSSEVLGMAASERLLKDWLKLNPDA